MALDHVGFVTNCVSSSDLEPDDVIRSGVTCLPMVVRGNFSLRARVYQVEPEASRSLNKGMPTGMQTIRRMAMAIGPCVLRVAYRRARR